MSGADRATLGGVTVGSGSCASRSAPIAALSFALRHAQHVDDLAVAIQIARRRDPGPNAFVLSTQIDAADGRIIVLPPIRGSTERAFLRLDARSRRAARARCGERACLLGNVAPASHGETVRNEILGDGDASQAFQRFALRKKPVTYVPAPAPGGVASIAVECFVNGVRWHEVPTLYGRAPSDQVYATRHRRRRHTAVQFGDGVTGARRPTGRQNIVATYRQGLGLAGRVGAGKLTTLLDRPTGVKGVTNPLAADGGADPEAMDARAQAAPGTVRTFGRAVSLRDFEDTALMAGEVAKAQATWVWNGERRAIHLTVAGAGRRDVLGRQGCDRDRRDAGRRTRSEPQAADRQLRAGRRPGRRRRSSSTPATSRRRARRRRARRAARRLVLRRSGDFAQPVYLSDVYRVLQDVAGVVASTSTPLDLKSTDPAFRTAHGVDDTPPQPQARLLMLPARPARRTRRPCCRPSSPSSKCRRRTSRSRASGGDRAS